MAELEVMSTAVEEKEAHSPGNAPSPQAAAVIEVPVDRRHPAVCAPIDCDGKHDPEGVGAVRHGDHFDDHVGHAHHFRHGDHCDLHGCC